MEKQSLHALRHGACTCCSFLPPYIVRSLSESDDVALRRIAFDTLGLDASTRTKRELNPARVMGRSAMPGLGYRRKVYDMEGRDWPLPGELRRQENGPLSADEVVNQAFENAGITYNFYKKVFGRESLDNAGYPLISSVHYGVNVANAYWNGTQMIYGDTDGHYFLPFTRSLGIAAHEMTHGVISFETNLTYANESGALNESFCDVMGTTVEQWHQKIDVAEAAWTIGREIAGPGLGRIDGFRTFSADKAFENHPELGTDPQPKHYAHFVHTTDDHGGVHLNSGIPNHAFYLAAQALGGKVWDRTARIWYQAFTKDLSQSATFVNAATATALAAKRLFDDATAIAVVEAWRAVGIESEV